jgi:hypothetical protein
MATLLLVLCKELITEAENIHCTIFCDDHSALTLMIDILAKK